MRFIVRRFGERLPLVTWDMAETGGIFAIVGPTGVGKTTSLAKIAARFVLQHSVDELGLVSTDTYRIGARQQLANFARILRAPMHVAESAQDLRRVLEGFANKKLVLIDTAGMSQRDVRLANQFTTLNVDGYDVRTVLALSAGADRGCLAEAMNVFKAAKPEALIVTKLDEAVDARRRVVAGDQERSARGLSLRWPARAGGLALCGAETVLAAAQRAEAVGECADGARRARARGTFRSHGVRRQCVI